MKIAIGTDHAGFTLKEKLKAYLSELGYEVTDFGAYEMDKDDDYPDFIFPAAWAVADGEADRAIILGSSGEGEAMAANRVKGVRAVVYYGHVDPISNDAKAEKIGGLIHESREDNDSNVLSIGASFVGEDEAKRVVKEWLETPFTGAQRHKRRIEKHDQ